MKEREGGKDAERRTGAGKKLIEAEISEMTEVHDPVVHGKKKNFD